MVFHPRAMGVVFLRLHETRGLIAENGMDSRTMLLFNAFSSQNERVFGAEREI